jgi:hypothetical protein
MLDPPRAIFSNIGRAVESQAHFDKMSFRVAVKSKRGAEISTLFLDSPSSQWELQQDLGVLAHQAFPLELRYRLPHQPVGPPAGSGGPGTPGLPPGAQV